MKKLAVLVFVALSMFATTLSNKADNSFPSCDPCPWVR
jgi:hypothetical protein